MSLSTLRWPLLALLGLIVAVTIALLATRAVSEDIGISSEPPSAGRALSPPAPQPGGHDDQDGRTTDTKTKTTPTTGDEEEDHDGREDNDDD